jgi:hypothetical protein
VSETTVGAWSQARYAYERHGFHLVRDLIDPAEAAVFSAELEHISGLPADDHAPVLTGHSRPFYRHGGVAASPGLWPLLVNRRLVATVAQLLDAEPKCLPGIDTISMHASEIEPHRDASPNELPALADAPFARIYPVARVILYPNSPGERFGCLPGSHRQAGRPSQLIAAGGDTWKWNILRSGDGVVFDPRLVHAGAPLTNPKPMVILTYGVDGPHALQTYFHARIKTPNLGFTDPPDDLVQLLIRERLLLDGVTQPVNWDHFSAVWKAENITEAEQ